MDLVELQNRIYKDPDSYRLDFEQQLTAFDAHLDILRLQSQTDNKQLCTLLGFLAQTAGLYREDLAKDLPTKLINLLDNAALMHPQIRLAIVRALFTMRTKRIVCADSLTIVKLVIPFLAFSDKILRASIEALFVRDLRYLFKKQDKEARAIQNSLLIYLDQCRDHYSSYNAPFYRSLVDIAIKLFRYNHWKDTRTVNAMIAACHCPYSKASGTALSFFVSGYKDIEDEEEDEGPDIKYNQEAIDLVHDPVEAGRKLVLISRDKSMGFNPRQRIMCLQVASLLSRRHEVDIPGFYSCIINFLSPSVPDVSLALATASQAVHSCTAPDQVTPVVKAIADRFVSDRNRSEELAIGITAIRELTSRCPWAMDVDLLLDLIGYIKDKNKPVVMAARSLLQSFREVAPDMLPRKARGRPPKKERDQSEGDDVDKDDDEESECEGHGDFELDSDDDGTDEEERINDLTMFQPPAKRAKTRDERYAMAHGGDSSFISNAEMRRMKKGGGTSNKVKEKKKSFVMVRNSQSKRRQKLAQAAVGSRRRHMDAMRRRKATS
ncbi:hypothetical protein GEMRC1_011393 [Eukaryota sp. GEM-RC1]